MSVPFASVEKPRPAWSAVRSITRGANARLVRGLEHKYRLTTAAARSLPDFVIIGAQKAGTSSLYAYLSKHPNVFAASRKEIHFFDSPAYASGELWYRAHFPLRLLKSSLQAVRGQRTLTGEASPYYLAHPATPARMRDLIPAARLLVMLRNPIDRALSHYQHQVRKGRESLTFAQAIAAEGQRTCGELPRMIADESYYSREYWGYSYLARGEYAEQLERWFNTFPREQFLVLSSEEFFTNPGAVYSRALKFLDLPEYAPCEYSRVNSGGSYGGMATVLREQLRQHFAAPNQRLYDLLRQDFGWD